MARSAQFARGSALVAVLLLAGLAWVGPAQAQTTPTTLSTTACTAKAINVLYWPLGHPALPGVGFANFPIPHSEVYLGSSTTYPDADFLAYFDYEGNRNFHPSCTASTSPTKVKALPAKKTSTASTTTVLACTFKKAPKLDVSQVPGSTDYQLRVVVGKTVEVTDRMGATASSLTYDNQACKIAAPLA